MAKDFIDECFSKQCNLEISASSIDNSVYSLVKIYEKAINSILIYSHSLREDVFESEKVIQALTSFISTNENSNSRILEILLKDDVGVDLLKKHALVKSVLENKSSINSVLFYVAGADVIKTCKSNFSIADERMYRMSKDFSGIVKMPCNDSGLMGVVNANDIKTCTHLNQVFERFKKHSRLLDVDVK